MTNYYEAWECNIDKDRVIDLYNELVNLTSNTEILHNERDNLKLTIALELMEYILGNDEDNPIENWFNGIT